MFIRQKLFISFLVVVTIPILFLSYLSLKNTSEALRKEEFRKLESIIDLKLKRIESIFEWLKEDIAISQGFYNIKLNLPILIQFRNNRTNPVYMEATNTLYNQLKIMLKNKGLLDIRLTDLDGKILYAVDKSHRDKEEGRTVQYYSKEALNEWKKGVWFSDIFKHENHFAMLIIAPAYDLEEKITGFIVFEVNMGPIYEIIQDTTGLGETGETLIAKKTSDGALYLNILRHDKEAALKRKVIFGSASGFPALEAVQGRKGIGISTDYRGEKVIAAWRYMPSLAWGVVAKIDTREAFAPIEHMKSAVILFTIIAVILTAMLSFWIAKSFSDPIHRLHKGTEIIGSGNLDYKVGVATRDEIGQLSRSFDEMAHKLKESQENIIRSERLSVIGKLASSVAHELRNPLGVIKNVLYYLNMLGLSKDNPEVKENLDIIAKEIEDSDKIITDLLEFARAKKPALRPENINHIVKEALDRLKIGPDIQVVLELADNLPDIEMDALQIQQVFYNIVKNALEAMEKGGKLTVNTGIRGDFMELSVSDTGSGIPEDDLTKVFEPLFSTKTKGTGLGLSVCASLVEGHNGKIEVKSELGKGATFTVKLPIRKG